MYNLRLSAGETAIKDSEHIIWYISCTGVECSVLHQVAAFVGGKAMSAWPVSDVSLAVRLYIVIYKII